MKKKCLLVFVLTIFIVAGTFAQPKFGISTGAGGYITNDFGSSIEASAVGIKAGSLKTPNLGAGAYAFLDFTFLEASLGFFKAGGEWENYIAGLGTNKFDTHGTGMDIGLMAKFPVFLSKKFAIFPLIGIKYRSMLSAELEEYEIDDPGDLSALWYRLGGGLDYFFTENIFLRTEFLYGLRQNNKFEKEIIDFFESTGAKLDSKNGNGFDIRLAAGYRF